MTDFSSGDGTSTSEETNGTLQKANNPNMFRMLSARRNQDFGIVELCLDLRFKQHKKMIHLQQ